MVSRHLIFATPQSADLGPPARLVKDFGAATSKVGIALQTPEGKTRISRALLREVDYPERNHFTTQGS